MNRVGLGYDIHRLVPGRPLVLGGVTLPHDRGLEGHSDADVLVHAIMDAILGAAALDDIGEHFPPHDPGYLDASSVALLEQVVSLARHAGYRIVNVDVSLVAEEPKIGKYRQQMRETLAAALGIGASEIGIKATTNEGVGAEGRREAISATAVALIETLG